ncbi:MAG: hypothetical protein Q7S07_03340 [Candidatus Omnitrophota bacterium]|nr:hypothetical protein [Candidatus Omnitrophota bacterium]
MNFKTIFAVVLIAVIVIISQGLSYAQDQAADQTGVLSKLDQVLNNQKIIMDEISSLRQELNIVKIRVTQSQ